MYTANSEHLKAFLSSVI